ncbi:hypothetical protein [Ulvibacterium sp.]|uniref:hypothetical protein n=1 Tax=Ulvibacterium sp. TaxID=2665914 RepID=UPI003BAD6466
MFPEYKLVQKCLRQIEDDLGWGASSEWHNDMFVELSEQIQRSTQVLLSPTTLKRVWGRVNYQSAPSITTLNTLAQFAGFHNWRDFKNATTVKKPSWFSQKVNPNLGIIMLGASIMTLVFISLYSLKGSKNNMDAIDISKIGFTSRPITSGLPNSVVFDLELNGIQSDSIHIQQYWDPTKTIKLRLGQKQATGQYYFPGYFRAKLLVDGTVLKQHDLFIKTEGWLGTLDYNPIPKYVPEDSIRQGALSFSQSILEEITSNEQPFSTTFHRVNDFTPVSGDNFTLTTSIRNIYREKWAVCQNALIIILGTKSTLIVPFSIPGCVSEIGVMMSDVYISGKEHDLSGLGVDLSVTRDFKIEVRNKRLRVFLEDEQLFTGEYNESIGTIAGIRYRFLGAGEVSYTKLTDLSGNAVAIEDDFE